MANLKIISPAQRKHRVYWEHTYTLRDDPGAGYSFLCSSRGDPFPLMEMAQQNLDWCQNHPEQVIDEGVAERDQSWLEHATGGCDCGHELYLDNPLWNRCPCGRLYNCWGQEVQAWQGWWEDTGEYLSDTLMDYDPEALPGAGGE